MHYLIIYYLISFNGFRPVIHQLTRVKKMENLYIENGYKNRSDYLENLALDMGIDKYIVFSLADLLGSIEDFDGLVSSLEDYSEGY